MQPTASAMTLRTAQISSDGCCGEEQSCARNINNDMGIVEIPSSIYAISNKKTSSWYAFH